jgi:chromate transporter
LDKEIHFTDYKTLSKEEKRGRWKEIFIVFLKLGILAFGGPAAHIAMMDDEIVKNRKWLSRERFVDLIGATNLIPGPNSTELAIFLGLERGGVIGLFIAGTAFILPAMLIVLGFAMIYVAYGTIPEVTGILYGIKAVIMAIILQALYRLGKSVIRSRWAAALALAVVALSFMGIREIPLLFLAGLTVMLVRNSGTIRSKFFSFSLYPFAVLSYVASQVSGTVRMSIQSIFLTFLKIGSVLYGSGYVLLAFLQAEFVDTFNAITSQQLLDAVAVGQFTPGPVFTTATFIGYLIQGFPGAIAATLGIFIPSFLVVAILNPFIPRMRASKVFSGLLDGVNIASLGLMLVVTLRLGAASIIDPLTAVLFAVAFLIIMKFRINSAWLIIAGGLIGYLTQIL